MEEKWVLLAEDDKLFASLFTRFWNQSYPHVPLVCVSTTVHAREVLSSRSPPTVAVLDHTLEDGTSEELFTELSCPAIIWSACAEGDLLAKPKGRDELCQAVRSVAERGGVVPSQ